MTAVVSTVACQSLLWPGGRQCRCLDGLPSPGNPRTPADRDWTVLCAALLVALVFAAAAAAAAAAAVVLWVALFAQ